MGLGILHIFHESSSEFFNEIMLKISVSAFGFSCHLYGQIQPWPKSS